MWSQLSFSWISPPFFLTIGWSPSTRVVSHVCLDFQLIILYQSIPICVVFVVSTTFPTGRMDRSFYNNFVGIWPGFPSSGRQPVSWSLFRSIRIRPIQRGGSCARKSFSVLSGPTWTCNTALLWRQCLQTGSVCASVRARVYSLSLSTRFVVCTINRPAVNAAWYKAVPE